MKFIFDSAFSSANIPYLIRSSQDYLTVDDNLQDADDQLLDLQIKREATSVRQSAKRGMRGVQSSFPCLKDTLLYEEYGERRIILTSLLLIFNLHARLVGINQITSVYYPAIEININFEFMPL